MKTIIEKAHIAIKSLPKLPNIIPRKIAENIKVNLKSISFEVDPIQNYTMQLKVQKLPVFAEAMNRNLTGIFFHFLDYKVEKKEPSILEWKGGVRTGKTTGAISTHKYIAQRSGVEFTIEMICPNEQYFVQRIPYAANNTSMIVDEQMEQHTGLGAFREMQHTEDLNNIIAKNNISVSWIHPPDFVGRNAFYGLETAGRNFEHKLTKFLIYDLTQKTFGVSSIPLGFVIVPKYDDIKFETEYEKRKDAHIDALKNESIAVRQQSRLDEGFALAKNKLYQRMKNNHQKIQLARRLFPMRTEGEYMELVSIANMNIKLGINQLDFDNAKTQVDKDLKDLRQANKNEKALS
jgi:hypothetical protein